MLIHKGSWHLLMCMPGVQRASCQQGERGDRWWAHLEKVKEGVRSQRQQERIVDQPVRKAV